MLTKLHVLPVLTTLALGLSLDIIRPSRLWQPNGTLHLPPLPNPYPVPNRPFTIDFNSEIGDVELNETDALRVIDTAIHTLVNDIRVHGDRPIPSDPLEAIDFESGTVYFTVESLSEPPDPFVTYNDTIAILDAFSLKMSREGYCRWFGLVESTGGGAALAEASVSDWI